MIANDTRYLVHKKWGNRYCRNVSFGRFGEIEDLIWGQTTRTPGGNSGPCYSNPEFVVQNSGFE